MIRFVCGPDGTVVPDIARKLPGRGVWVTATRALVEAAAARKRFARGFRQQCIAPADLPDQVDRLLERKALGFLSLANKAGLVVQGFDKVAGAIAKARAALLVAASDGADTGRIKLKNKLGNAELIETFTTAQLSLALGRTNVIHAAVAPGTLSEKFLAAARQLETFRC